MAEDFPGVEVNLKMDPTPKPPELVFVHLDEYDETDITSWNRKEPHVYVFQHEDREDDVVSFCEDLNREYICATALAWPDWMEGRIKDFSTEMLTALEWVIALGSEPEPEHVEIIEDHL